ncbi:MAG: hypothetical protein R3C68_17160 [Myxococcota bacterium]
MSSIQRTKPVSLKEASEIGHDVFRIVGTATVLPSYEDQNFRIESGERRYVLKLTHRQSIETLDLQNRAIAHLHGKVPWLRLPGFTCEF